MLVGECCGSRRSMGSFKPCSLLPLLLLLLVNLHHPGFGGSDGEVWYSSALLRAFFCRLSAQLENHEGHQTGLQTDEPNPRNHTLPFSAARLKGVNLSKAMRSDSFCFMRWEQVYTECAKTFYERRPTSIRENIAVEIPIFIPVTMPSSIMPVPQSDGSLAIQGKFELTCPYSFDV